MAEYIAREVLLAQLRAIESYNASPMYRRGYDDCVEAILKRLPPMLYRWCVAKTASTHLSIRQVLYFVLQVCR